MHNRKTNADIINEVLNSTLDSQEAILNILGISVDGNRNLTGELLKKLIKTIRTKVQLACHPDKNLENQNATPAFQKINAAIDRLFMDKEDLTPDHDPNDTITNRVILMNISRSIFLHSSGFPMDIKIDTSNRGQILLAISKKLERVRQLSKHDTILGIMGTLSQERINLLSRYADTLFPVPTKLEQDADAIGAIAPMSTSSPSDEAIAAGFQWETLSACSDLVHMLLSRFPDEIQEPQSEYRQLKVKLIKKCRMILFNAAGCKETARSEEYKVTSDLLMKLDAIYQMGISDEYLNLMQRIDLLFPNFVAVNAEIIANRSTLQKIKECDQLLAACKINYPDVFVVDPKKIDLAKKCRERLLMSAYCASNKEHDVILNRLSTLCHQEKLITYTEYLNLDRCYTFLFQTCEGEDPEFVSEDTWDWLNQAAVSLSKIMDSLLPLSEVMDLIKKTRELLLAMSLGINVHSDQFYRLTIQAAAKDDITWDEIKNLTDCHRFIFSTPPKSDLDIVRHGSVRQLQDALTILTKLIVKQSEKIHLINKIRDTLLKSAACANSKDCANILLFYKNLYKKGHISYSDKEKLGVCYHSVFPNHQAESVESLTASFKLSTLKESFDFVTTLTAKLPKVSKVSGNGLFSLQPLQSDPNTSSMINYQFDFGNKQTSHLYVKLPDNLQASLVYDQLSNGCKSIMAFDEKDNTICIIRSTLGVGVYYNNHDEIVINFPNKADIYSCIQWLGFEKCPPKTYFVDPNHYPTKLFFGKHNNNTLITQLGSAECQPTQASLNYAKKY